MGGRFRPRLNKKLVTTQEGYKVCTVNAYTVRNIAQPDEEFANFATQDEFSDLIPPKEIWLADKTFEKEGMFFLANALVRLKALEKGASEGKAYDAGLEAERSLRESLNGIKFRDGKPHQRVPPELYVEPYITLDDVEFPVEVWLVDGNLVRSYYKTDYTEGGHGYVYRWVPRNQIWIERDLDRQELPFIVSHEYLELRLMRDKKIDYDTAHAICAKVEFNLRKGKGGTPILVPGRHRFIKRYVPRLTCDEIFQYVVKTYVKK